MAKFKSKPQKKDPRLSSALNTKRSSGDKDSDESNSSEEAAPPPSRPQRPDNARNEPQQAIPKKRAKMGSAALKEIKRLQKSTDLCIPKAPFLRIIRQIIFETTNNPTYRITEAAVEALREASESVLVSIMEDSYLLALHSKRVTLFPRDINLLLRLRHDPNLQP